MRRTGIVVLVGLLIAVVFATRWFLGHGTSTTPVSAGGPATESNSADAGAPAAASADGAVSAARVEEPGPVAVALPPAGPGRVRGIVLMAAGGLPAAGARVRAMRGRLPLSKIEIGAEMRNRGSNRKPAPTQDLEDESQINTEGDSPTPPGAEVPDGVQIPAEPPKEFDTGLADAGKSHDHHEDDDDEDDGADRPPLAEAIAGPDGSFELTGLAEGTVHVTAQLSGAITERNPRVTIGTPPLVEGIELRLVPGAAVSGRVIGPDGQPIARARVVLGTNFDPFSMFSADGFSMRVPGSTVTDATGAFAFTAVPAPLELTLRAQAEGMASSEARKLTVAPGDDARVELVLARGAEIAVFVVDDQGKAVAKASCTLQPTRIDFAKIGADPGSIRNRDMKTDVDGVARLRGVAPGTWRVSAKAAGFLLATRQVDCPVAGTKVDVELHLERGKELSGTVAARDGTPVAGARLRAALEPSMLNISANLQAQQAAWESSDATGAFHLVGLPSGKLQLEVHAKGYEETRLPVEAGGPPVPVVLQSRGILEGIVVSRKTGKPVQRFDIKVERKSEGVSFMDPKMAESMMVQTLPFATPNGKFRITGVTPGTLRLLVTAAEHGPGESDWIDLAQGDTKKVGPFYLPPEAVVEGIVVEAATGKPVPSASVRREVNSGNFMEKMFAGMFGSSGDSKSDAEGRFRMDGLPAGSHRFAARREGFMDAVSDELTLDEGQVLTGVRLELAVGAEIWGVVSAPDGTPAAAATVFCQEQTRFKMQSTKSDSRGEYHLVGLIPGSYALTRMPESFDLGGENFIAEMTSSIETHNVKLKAGEVLRLDFTGPSQGSCTLTGKVTQAGAPIAGALVNVVAQGKAKGTQTGMRSGSSAKDGTFEITGLVAGPALVQVNGADFGTDGGLSAAVTTAVLREGETTRVDIEIPAGSITGNVVAAGGGAALGGVAVYATNEDEDATDSTLELAMRRAAAVHTAADGTFRLKNLRAGRYRVTAGGADLLSSGPASYAVVRKGGIAVGDGATADAGTLRLPQGGRLHGTVNDTQGHALAGASVFLREPGSGDYLEEWSASSSDEGGGFDYGGIPAGAWDVVCRAPGHAVDVAHNVVVTEGGTSNVTFRLMGGTEVFADVGEIDFAQAISLKVEVEGPQGRIPLTLFGLGDLADLMARPFTPDVVRLGRFPPGEYRVHGSLGGRKFAKTFKLAGEAELHVPVELPLARDQ